MAVNDLIPRASLDSLYIMGTKIKGDIKEAITSADLSMSTTQITQLSLDVFDPKFKILATGIFVQGVSVRYKDLRFVVSNVETRSEGGVEALTIKCRPEVVQKLKNLRGTKVMNSASPSDFVIAECKAVGATYHVEASPSRKSVARDKPTAKETYEPDSEPSSWTTFLRLADELNYLLFEIAGVIYFGKPSYFLKKSKASPLVVSWNTGNDDTLSEVVPACVRSVDSKSITVQVTLPLERAAEARVGRALKLVGVPTFDGYYLIDDVNYSLSDLTSRVEVSSSKYGPVASGQNVVSHATKQILVSTIATPPAGTIYQTVTNSSTGVLPVSAKYPIVTDYGIRGNWPEGYHSGIDYGTPEKTPVYAVYDGDITINEWGSVYGDHVILTVGNLKYGYIDLDTISVYGGQRVHAGDIIGYSKGTHFHFELRVAPYTGESTQNPLNSLLQPIVGANDTSYIDSAKYMAGRTNTLLSSDFVTWALSRINTDITTNQIDVDISDLIQWSLFKVGINFPTDVDNQLMVLAGAEEIDLIKAYRVRGAVLADTRTNTLAISLGTGKIIKVENGVLGVYTVDFSYPWNKAYLLPELKYQ